MVITLAPLRGLSEVPLGDAGPNIEPEADPLRDEPVWMLRLNPLERSRLADDRLSGLLAELADVERELAQLSDACSDALYDRIGSAEGGERGALVALRRAIHNDRTPARLPEEFPAEVERWLDCRAWRERVRAELAAVHPEALAGERRALTALLDDEDLLRSLALSAPEVYEAAVRYQDGTNARARKSERGLLQFATRAMMRTSPLSRFTAVGLAVPDRDGVDVDQVRFASATAVPELDRVMLAHVLDGLAESASTEADPEAAATIGPATWVRQPPTLGQGPDRDRLYFRVTDERGTRRLSTPLTTPVQLLLESTAMGPRRLGDVARDLAGALDCPEQAAAELVRNATRMGFLTVAAGQEDCGDDLLEAATANVTAAAAPQLAELKDRLAASAARPHQEWAREIPRLREITDELSRTAGRPAAVTVTEDYVLPPARLDTRAWGRQLDDLAGSVELLSVFDRLHDVRAVLTEVFVERFGRGAAVPLAEHARALVRAVYQRETTDVASLRDLRELRTRMLGTLQADLTRPDRRGSQGEEVVWPVEEITALAGQLPERFRVDPLSYGVLVQPADGRLVLNDAYAGNGMLYGRFLGPDARLGGEALPRLRRQLRGYGSDGARVVEDRGLHRLNVNAHTLVLEDGLHAEDWYRLRLVHDPELDRLHVEDEDGRRLRVLTLGTGHPELYPAPLRIANWLVSGGRLRPDLGLRDGLAGSGPADRDPAVGRALPRLCAGSVVLQRRRWYGGAEFAEAARTPEDLDRLLALTRWRARHGVPAEVMLKPVTDWAERRAAATGGASREPDRQRKPQYVDLSSALLTRALPRFLERRGEDYLEEALPGAAYSPHATEWVVEISRPSGGRFEYRRYQACD